MKSVRFSRLAAVLATLSLALATAGGGAAHAAGSVSGATFTSERDTVTLISGDTAVSSGQSPMLALRFALKPGWHTYWSNPGDAGAAADAKIAYAGAGESSAPAQPVMFDWPLPRRLPDGPLMSYGYVDSVTLPIRAPAPQNVGPNGVDLRVDAEWLVCADVCVPENATFTLHLPQGPSGATPAASPDRAAITAARAALPASEGPSVRFGKGDLLHVAMSLPNDAKAWFLPATPGVIDQLADQTIARSGDGFTLALKPATPGSLKLPLDGVLVVQDAGGAEHGSLVRVGSGATPAAGAPKIAPVPAAGLLRAVVLAILGGLILNLMPCVFPVLAMKAIAVARMSGAERRHVRLGALFYTGGVLVAFAAIGALTLILRGATGSVGWGFQFQSVAFVGAIAWLLFLVGLNLSGVFEIGTGTMGLGQGVASRGGHLGEAATGLLAVLVATPCTAPFMGVALATALSGPAVEAMVIFLALGLGLALPYLLLALVPRLASLLPKPGGWMEILRHALAFPVYAAVVWLVWVATQQGGASAVLFLGVGLLLLALAAWLFGLGQKLRAAFAKTDEAAHRNVRRARFCGVLSVAALLSALALLPRLARTGAEAASTQTASSTMSGLPTEAFSQSRLDALLADHKPVFVDMSAAWCVTCLVNEKVAFSSPEVRRAFTDRKITILRGDWTRYDPAITRYLASLGRDGVPLYVWYGADGAAQVLPQVLTPGTLLDLVGK